MPPLVRRLGGRNVVVEFAHPIEPASTAGVKLLELETQPEVTLLREGDAITGIQCPDKAYVEFLTAMNASKDTIRAFRAALDDSKKARRERMRR